MLEPKIYCLEYARHILYTEPQSVCIIHLLLFSASEVCYTAIAYWYRELPTG